MRSLLGWHTWDGYCYGFAVVSPLSWFHEGVVSGSAWNGITKKAMMTELRADFGPLSSTLLRLGAVPGVRCDAGGSERRATVDLSPSRAKGLVRCIIQEPICQSSSVNPDTS